MEGGLCRAVSETGQTNFDEIWVTDSTLNEGTNSQVMSELGQRGGSSYVVMHERHKTCNGWYLGKVMLVSSIVGFLVLYSENVLGLQ